MTNSDVARVFEEVADLMDIRGDDSFRVSSYRRVARTLMDLAEDVNDIAARGQLTELPGVGKASAEKIGELLHTGRMRLHDELTEKVPPSLLELTRIPSLGPKKIAILWKTCGITSLAELKGAIAIGALNGIKGFGEKTVAQISAGIAFRESTGERLKLGTAWFAAQRLREAVAAIPGVARVEIAGSLRRGKETIGDLDLLCVADDGQMVVDRFTRIMGTRQVLAAGATKGSILFDYRAGRSVQVDLRVVPAESFGAAWQYFTGSKEHNVRLREAAVKRGWTLNEWGLMEGDQRLAGENEEGIYERLGFAWAPPELREDRGEFELRAAPPHLLRSEDIHGDLHLHTTASDGRNTIEEMIEAAKLRGYRFVCITDHSQSSTIANGLKPERLREHIADVRRVASKTSGIRVWVGAEVDIKLDGALDYEDDLLAQLDWVVASVHAGQGRDGAHNTQRTLAAIRNRHVNVIAHPTGRLLGERDAMPLDIETIAREAARTGTALEINASRYRLDLKDTHARLARDLGVKIAINTDAHAIDQYDEMRFGVLTGRRAWLNRDDVVNTWSPDRIEEFVRAKRSAPL